MATADDNSEQTTWLKYSSAEKTQFLKDEIIKHEFDPLHILPGMIGKCPDRDCLKSVETRLQRLVRLGKGQDARKLFLDTLTQCKDSQWYENFVDSLKKSDHHILAYMLTSGNSKCQDSENCRLLDLFYEILVDTIIPSNILPALKASDCLNNNDNEQIMAEERSHGPRAGAMMLICRIPFRNLKWYQIFMGILDDQGYEQVVGQIDPDFTTEKRSREKLKAISEDTESFSDTRENVVVFSSLPAQEKLLAPALSLEEMPSSSVIETAGKAIQNQLNMESTNALKKEPTKILNIDLDDCDESAEKVIVREHGDGAVSPTSSSEDNPLLYSDDESETDIKVTAKSEVKKVLEPGLEPVELVLRNYQKELARPALNGNNAIICSPTGSGKTHVALKIAKTHLDRGRDRGNHGFRKVLFLVNKVPLADQQYDMFQKYLCDYKCVKLHGEQTDQPPLKYLIKETDVFVMTAQILVDAMNAAEDSELVSLSSFTLMIFDECHHTHKGHPYNQIMGQYLDLKDSKPEEPFPQVIGLTASLGVGKAKTEKQAVQHIMSLCANLDAACISTVSDNIIELSKHVNVPKEDMKRVEGRKEDPFRDIILHVISLIEDRMKKTPGVYEEIRNFDKVMATPHLKGDDAYTQWVSQKRRDFALIENSNMRRDFMSYLRYLKAYNEALIINSDCRMKDSLEKLLGEFSMPTNKQKYTEVDHWLQKSFEDNSSSLRSISESESFENPMLKALEEMITNVYKEMPDSRGIIFVKTRDLTAALQNWIKENTRLKFLKPERLVGAGASADKSGMTQTEQVDVLRYFKDGRYNIVIATSVAEEGLDIQACNLVIRYGHVTNEIAMVQARGRGRAEGAKFMLVAESGKGSVAKEQLNILREAMMQRAMKRIQQMPQDKFNLEKENLQKESKLERDMVARAKLQRRLTNDDEYELRCFKCDELACISTYIKKVEQSHHVILDPTITDRVLLVEHPRPVTYDTTSKTSKVYCMKCHLDWGIEILHKNTKFIVIKIDSFVLVDIRGNRTTCRKWKKSPFDVQPITHADWQAMLETIP